MNSTFDAIASSHQCREFSDLDSASAGGFAMRLPPLIRPLIDGFSDRVSGKMVAQEIEAILQMVYHSADTQ